MGQSTRGEPWIRRLQEIRSVGGGSAMSIIGEPGTGKTTLLEATIDCLSGDACDVLRVAWTAAEGTVAWSGLVALVAQLDDQDLAPLSDVQVAGLRLACGEPGEAGATVPPDALTIAPTVAAALRVVLRARAAERPTILALDDLHWADTATAAAIAASLRHLADEPLTVIAAQRPTAEPVVDFERLYGERLVAVTPASLDEHEVVAVLRDHGVDLTLPLLQEVTRLGGGNPLYTRLLAEEIARTGGSIGRLPASIAAVHRHRWDQLDEVARRVVQYAALHGRPDAHVLAVALGREASAIEAALLAAEEIGLIDGDRFVHPTVPAAVIDATGERRRSEILRRLAAALPVGDELRAVHLAAAAEDVDAALADELEAAASQALGRGARNEAGERFLRSASLTPDNDVAGRWRRELSAADAFWGAGNLRTADGPSRRAFDGAATPPERAIAGGVRLQVLAGLGDMVAAHRFVVELLDELDGWPTLRALLGRARVRLEQIVDLHRALATAEALTAEMRDAGLEAAALDFEIAALNCRYVIGEPIDPRHVWSLGQPVFDATDFISAGWMALEVFVWSGIDPETTTVALGEVERAARAAGSMQSLAKVHDFRANHLLRIGQWAEAEAEARRAVDLAELTRSTSNMAVNALSWVLAATGRGAQAHAVLAVSSVAVPDEQLPLFLAAHAASLGFIELCAGRPTEAVPLLEQAWHAAEKMGMGDVTAMPFRVDLIEALVMAGRLADAADRAAQLGELVGPDGLPAARFEVERAAALVSGAAGDIDGAELAVERAKRQRVDAPFERARMELGLGVALRRQGRRGAAARLLSDAASTFGHLGATPFLMRAEQELTRLGTNRSNGVRLTPTERLVADLVVEGASNAEIANALVVSTRTIEANLTRIYRKLDVRSRAQLIATLGRATSPATDVP